MQLQDIVPWSLIYGAQNDRHDKEMRACKDKLHNLALIVLENFLFLSSRADFMNYEGLRWKTWNHIVSIVSAADVDKVKDKAIETYKTFADRESLVIQFINEANWKASVLKKLILNANSESV